MWFAVAGTHSVTGQRPTEDADERRALISQQAALAAQGDLVLVGLQQQDSRLTPATATATASSSTAGVKYKPSALPAWSGETDGDLNAAAMRRWLRPDSRPAAPPRPRHASELRWGSNNSPSSQRRGGTPDGTQHASASKQNTSSLSSPPAHRTQTHAYPSSPPGVAFSSLPVTPLLTYRHSSALTYSSPERSDSVSLRMSQVCAHTGYAMLHGQMRRGYATGMQEHDAARHGAHLCVHVSEGNPSHGSPPSPSSPSSPCSPPPDEEMRR